MPLTIATSGIVATAFDLLEQASPSSLGEGTDKAASAERNYIRARDSFLELADWNFASEFLSLPEADEEASGAISDPEMPHAYTLPGEVLVVRKVGDGLVKWRRHRTFLRADQAGPLVIRATARIEDETKFPATSQLALAYRLAVILAPKFTTSQSKRRELRLEAREVLQEAYQADALQASPARYDDLVPDYPDIVAEALL